MRSGGLFNALKCEDFNRYMGVSGPFSPDRCAKYAADRKNILELFFQEEDKGHTMPDMVQGAGGGRDPRQLQPDELRRV